MKAQKAIVAVARRLLKVVYNTFDTLTIYKEKGIAHFTDLQAKAALLEIPLKVTTRFRFKVTRVFRTKVTT